MHPGSTGNINPKDITLAEALRSHGYKTVHIGKWHLQNHTDQGKTHYPEKHGFDINIAGFRMGQPGSYFFLLKAKDIQAQMYPEWKKEKLVIISQIL